MLWEAEGREDPPEVLDELRRTVAELTPEVQLLASRLGLSTGATIFPAPAFGGIVRKVDLLIAARYPEIRKRDQIPRAWVLDSLDHCIGLARSVRRKALVRLLSPWCWLVDVPALILRFPFLILRGAGVSPKIEETLVAQVVKVALLVGGLAAAAYLGITKADVLAFFGK